MKKKSFEQIENELLNEFLDEDEDKDMEKFRRLRRNGVIDENGEPYDTDLNL